jgi:hypothetical protein
MSTNYISSLPHCLHGVYRTALLYFIGKGIEGRGSNLFKILPRSLDLNIQAANFVKVLGIINKIFKPSLVSRHTRIRVYKTLARPVLSYGSEAWTIRTDEKRLILAEMRFLRRTAGYTS